MQTLTLIHSKSFPIARYAEALQREAIFPRLIDSLDSLPSDAQSLRVVLVDPAISNGQTENIADRRTAIVGVGLVEEPRWLTDDTVYFDLPEDPSPLALANAVKRAYQFLYQKLRGDQLERQLSDRTEELRELSEVGIALSAERDHSVLLTTILSKARELSRSDAGSLYLLDEADGQKVLRWKLAQNDSIDVMSFEEKVLPITRRSLAGYVALTNETLVIDDAYNVPAGAEYTINRSFDEENHYLTRSMLVFPMMNHVGELIGVLQLINRKRPGAPRKLTATSVPKEVIPFDQETIELMRSLAGQAAVSVENNLLYESIERLFEGFVTAAVTAIEQRDPTTSGHSFRVADLTVELAKTVDHIDAGQYRDTHFSPDQVREIQPRRGAGSARPAARRPQGLTVTQPQTGLTVRPEVLGLIRDVPDYPSPGVLFKDITPLLADGPAFAEVVAPLAKGTARVTAGSPRGRRRGARVHLRRARGLALGVGFVPVRKVGKLPHTTISASYQLEYGTAEVEVHAMAANPARPARAARRRRARDGRHGGRRREPRQQPRRGARRRRRPHGDRRAPGPRRPGGPAGARPALGVTCGPLPPAQRRQGGRA